MFPQKTFVQTLFLYQPTKTSIFSIVKGISVEHLTDIFHKYLSKQSNQTLLMEIQTERQKEKEGIFFLSSDYSSRLLCSINL